MADGRGVSGTESADEPRDVSRPGRGARETDPRLYQIGALAGLLVYGLTALDFGITAAQASLTLGSALLAQYVFGRAFGVARFEPRSALISGLSLCLLLRTGQPIWAAAASVLAVSSKFLVRVRRKHVFNPTNVALVALLLATDAVWVSPGQWGASAILAFFVACAGGLVVHRALRSDVTFAFLAAYAGLLVARAVRLGDPLAIPLHQLQSGALLLFAFFMISDPRTTPDSRVGRVLFGVLVAAGALYVQVVLFRPNGLLWSLAACSPLVPLLDRLLPGGRFEWPGAKPIEAQGEPLRKGACHAPVLGVSSRGGGPRDGDVRAVGVGLLRLLRRQG
jgi:Na+-translocating ferredoxin:NAD+ oxidoreductase RnfD subunit